MKVSSFVTCHYKCHVFFWIKTLEAWLENKLPLSQMRKRLATPISQMRKVRPRTGESWKVLHNRRWPFYDRTPHPDLYSQACPAAPPPPCSTWEKKLTLDWTMLEKRCPLSLIPENCGPPHCEFPQSKHCQQN